MSEVTLFHNGGCSKSRAALDLLEKSKVPFRIVEYVKNPPQVPVLEKILLQLKMEPWEIVRKNEDEYFELQLEGLPKVRSEWIQILVEHPILIERPIVTDGFTSVLGRPPEKVLEWLKQR